MSPKGERERKGREKAFESTKRKRPNHCLGTWIASFHALLSKHNSIGIFPSSPI
jgi:hypothetical protein